MGDQGRLYVNEEVVPIYRNLLRDADLILPNQFEAEYVPLQHAMKRASEGPSITEYFPTLKSPPFRRYKRLLSSFIKFTEYPISSSRPSNSQMLLPRCLSLAQQLDPTSLLGSSRSTCPPSTASLVVLAICSQP